MNGGGGLTGHMGSEGEGVWRFGLLPPDASWILGLCFNSIHLLAISLFALILVTVFFCMHTPAF